MEEHRQFVRLDTRLELTYNLLPSGSPQRTITRNVSAGGLCLVSDRVLTPGSQLQISMQLPDHQAPIHFIGEVVWSDPYEIIGKTERQHAVETGLRFVEISPDDRDALMRHVILTLKLVH
jgi:c-di-GMP-binding flagellar brake protein YcgR